MRGNKGQAMVEFIIIMPIMMFIALGILDFGLILHSKYKLENNLDTLVDLYKSGDTAAIAAFELDNEIDFQTSFDGKYTNALVIKNVKVMTPGLNKVLGDPHVIKVSRKIYE